MKLNRTYLHSRLGRRILWLFVVCALLPISVLALVSLFSVSSELRQQSLRQLNHASHDEGMIIFERLTLLDAHLVSMANDLSKPSKGDIVLPGSVETHFRSIALMSPNGSTRSLLGTGALTIELSAQEQRFLDSGKTLLASRKCEDVQLCIYLVRQVDESHANRELVVAEVQPSYLWGADDLPGSAALAIFDQENRVLYDSAGDAAELPELAGHRSSGELEWEDGSKTVLGEYWKLPMKSKFFHDHWTILASEDKDAALASLAAFRRVFPLVILLALWIVLLLSFILIRRTLVPLEKLREGTGKIARGEFEARVQVQSRDEFQELATSFNLMAGRIQSQVRSLKTLNEIDRAILSSWDLEPIVKALVDRLPNLLPYEVVGITAVDFLEKKNATTYIAPFGGKLQTLRSHVSAAELNSLRGKPESFLLEKGGLCPQYLLPLVNQGMRRFLVVPVSMGTKLAAVLAFGRSTSEEWSHDDKQQAHRVADQVAVALSNASLVNQVKDMRWGTLTAFARAIDAKSPWTAGHSERVTATGVRIGQEMGLPQEEIDILHAGGLLHDVGKIGIPAALLDKPGALTSEERLQIQEHVLIGVRILKPIRSFEECLPIVQEHHERFDGKGYPYGIKGEDITLYGRIFAVADVHDALISERPYRKGLPLERVMAMIREGAGTQFDPQVVDAFFRVVAGSEQQFMEQERLAATQQMQLAEVGELQ